MGPPLRLLRCPACEGIDASGREDGAPCRACGAPMIAVDVFQPLGFRTDRRARDFDDSAERGFGGGVAQLAWDDHDEEPTRRGGIAIRSRSGQPLYVINDNRGQLFEFFKDSDGSVVVPAEDLYSEPPALRRSDFERARDFSGAIGSVRVTDVLAVYLDQLSIGSWRGPLEVTPSRPAALPALWSFAQLLRMSGAAHLDVDARELEIGLQPVAYHDANGREVPSRRIFLADQLENGAGYCRLLGEPDRLMSVLGELLDRVGARLERPHHAGRCDSACPDCLRSYENRFLHPLLDWRLGLDLAELAAGRALSERRWLDDGAAIADGAARAFGFDAVAAGDLAALRNARNGRTAILGHPLWPADEPRLRTAQEGAGGADRARCFDLYAARRWPEHIALWLDT